VSAGTLQEVQAARESLRQEILSVSALTVHSLLSSISPRFDRVEQYSYASARRVAINCGPGEVLVKTEVGYVLCSSTDHALLTCLIDTGELELGTRLLIQRFLRPGDVFVDVGANIGLHTLAAARSMQGLGKIIAFEPFEPTKRLLEKSVWINGFSEMTEIHQAAVSNHTGNQQLYLGPTSGHHSLFPLDPTGEVSLKPVEVHLVRLDEVVHADQKVDLIKIDAEGAELEVLDSGAAVILSNLDVALIVEFGPSHLKRSGQTAHQWFEAFAKLELLYRVINSDTGALEDWSLERLESTVSVNLFFARKDSKAWTRATT
jgi:FkbM family methyltransferase